MKELSLVLNHFGQSFLISGSPEKVGSVLGEELKKAAGLADFWGGYFNPVKIEDVRLLKTWHSQKSQNGGRYALLASPHFTREAQTALLKITEEPNADTTIILVTKNPHDLLDTLRSRLQLIITDEGVEELTKFKKFLTATPAERLTKQKAFIDLDADNHRELLGNLITGLKLVIEPNQTTAVRVLVKAEEFLGVSGLTAKNTYEYLATALPVLVK